MEMCQCLYRFLMQKNYSDTLNTIGIMPVVAPANMLSNWKEKIEFRSLNSCALVVIHLDFDKYHLSSSKGKCELMQTAILEAVKRVSNKSRVKFNYSAFEIDVLSFCTQHLILN